MNKLFARFVATAALAVLSACSSAPTRQVVDQRDMLKEYQEERAVQEKTKVVSPGFRLRIRHSADSEISGEFRVDFRGFLSLPYKVKMQAAGQELDELADKIEKAYASYFKVKNSVSIEVVSREFLVEVRGLVQKPGIYSVKLDTSLEELMAMSGGLVQGAPSSNGAAEGKTQAAGRPEYVRIVTPELMTKDHTPAVRWERINDYFLKYDVRNEILWRGGEQLFFQMSADAAAGSGSQTIQIMGDVHRPGEYPLQQGLDISWYIGQAGGPLPTGDMSNIVVIHKTRDEVETINFVDSTSRPLLMQPGDVILVKSTQFKPSTLERMGPFFVSLTSLMATIAIAILAL